VTIGYFLAAMAGALCLGGLVYVLIVARPDDRGVLDPAAFRGHLLVERVSPVWVAVAIVMVVVQAATDAGVPATRVLGSGQLGSAVGASETTRGWVAVAVFAAVLTLVSRLTVRWEWHVVMLIPAILGVVAVPVTGTAGQGADHDYTTSTVIVFALAVAVLTGLKVTAAALPVDEGMRYRCRIVSVAAGAVALLYGGLLLALQAGSAVFGSGYGRLGLLAAAALLSGWILDLRGRPARALAVASALTAVIAVAATSAMAVMTPPRLSAAQPTVWDVLLGYELSGAPTVQRLLTFWRFDTFLGALALVLAAGYVIGVVRLRRRGDVWPTGRLVSWLAGCAALVAATCSGVRAYGSAMFSIHMVEHMTLNMFAPVLLVLGAPATLALRALPTSGSAHPGPREWLLRFIHSPFTRFLSNPVTAFVLFVGSLYLVYFTPLFDTLVRYHWGHEFMGLHFLITGYLFYWGIIGIDPGPRRLPFIGRLGLLFAVMPFHAFFGIAMMTGTSPVGGDFYRGLALPWVPSLTDDQHLGGAIAWGASELPLLMVVIALITQWARQDRRDATRSDRHASAQYGGDDDLVAYNAMLQELARNRR
jgi:putative copper resistance protein D